jgi:hypothetical protein
MRQPIGGITLEKLLEAVNSLPPPTRQEIVAALKAVDPRIHYFTQHDGRVEAERA